MGLSVYRWASSARTTTAAAEPSETPEQSKMPSWPAMIGEQAMVSFGTSRRNWARGLSDPFLWFFHAMRVSTSFISSGSTPYFFEYAGASSENSAVADASRCHGSGLPSNRTGLPEVIVDPLGGGDLAERHLHPVADGNGGGVDVGDLAPEAAAAVEVDDRRDQRRAERERQPVDREGGDGGR